MQSYDMISLCLMQLASLQSQWQALIAACKDVASLEEALGPESIQHAIGHESGFPATERMAELSATIPATSTTRSHLTVFFCGNSPCRMQNDDARLGMTEDLGSHVLPFSTWYASSFGTSHHNSGASERHWFHKEIVRCQRILPQRNKRNLLHHQPSGPLRQNKFQFHTQPAFKAPRPSKNLQHHCINAQWLALIKALSLNMF